MYLKITTTDTNASNIGYVFHKHPERYQKEKLSYGEAHIFYPEVSEQKCSFAMLIDINSIQLTRNLQKSNYSGSFKLGDYVNDRAYVASSFLTAAIAKVLSSALNGKCSYDNTLATKKWNLTIQVGIVKAKGGEEQIKNYFEPLGYEVCINSFYLDEDFKNWGKSPYFKIELKASKTVQEVLSQLYVLLPVLDNNKHYFVNEMEVEKLLNKGGEWLKNHPAKEIITKKYLRYKKSYTRLAFEHLIGEETSENSDKVELETMVEKKLSIHGVRLHTVKDTLAKLGVQELADLGCGEGKLIRLLLREAQFKRILGMDVSYQTIEMAKKRLKYDELPLRLKEKLSLFQGSLTYRDKRIEGIEAVSLVEVIEHLDTTRLEALQRVVFEYTKPKYAIITTPNREYNVLFESLPEGKFRHSDHRFEWTRKEFETWANKIANRHAYKVSFEPIGDEHEIHGAISQMAVFKRD